MELLTLNHPFEEEVSTPRVEFINERKGITGAFYEVATFFVMWISGMAVQRNFFRKKEFFFCLYIWKNLRISAWYDC